jgi:hypothetical protein
MQIGSFEVSELSKTADASLEDAVVTGPCKGFPRFCKIVNVDAHMVQTAAAALQVFAVQRHARKRLDQLDR